MGSDRHRSPWQVRAEAGEPLSVVHVRDLQATIRAGTDAWGRTNKEQPVSISAELWLAHPFQTAASNDRVTDDTVHYGQLSKAILSSLKRLGQPGTLHEKEPALTIHQVVEHLLDGVVYSGESGAAGGVCEKIFHDSRRLRYARLTVALPKASLLGEAVSFSHHRSWPAPQAALWCRCLQIHRLRVPTLIGVNDNERKARQVVVADIEADGGSSVSDIYAELESRVVKTMENSSFETLEALATTIAAAVSSFLSDEANAGDGWQVKVGLEKPTAIPMAQAARVEYRLTPS